MNEALLSQSLFRRSLILFADVSVPDLSTTDAYKECCRCPFTISNGAVTSSVFPLVGTVVWSLFKQLIRTTMLVWEDRLRELWIDEL